MLIVDLNTGMHTIKEKPVVVDGQIVIRPIMVVALTYDHRMVDGREAVTFLGEYIGEKSEWVDLMLLNSASERVLGRPAKDVTALGGSCSWTLHIDIAVY
jgi:hypothetical protein